MGSSKFLGKSKSPHLDVARELVKCGVNEIKAISMVLNTSGSEAIQRGVQFDSTVMYVADEILKMEGKHA